MSSQCICFSWIGAFGLFSGNQLKWSYYGNLHYSYLQCRLVKNYGSKSELTRHNPVLMLRREKFKAQKPLSESFLQFSKKMMRVRKPKKKFLCRNLIFLKFHWNSSHLFGPRQPIIRVLGKLLRFYCSPKAAIIKLSMKQRQFQRKLWPKFSSKAQEKNCQGCQSRFPI